MSSAPSKRSDDSPWLQARQLGCERGDRVLFEALEIDLSPGEALQIAGPNGSGKTTLLRVLCGLVLPSEGEILWRGQSIDRHREALLSDLCYLGYAGGVKLELSAAENLRFMRDLHRFEPSSGLQAALERVELYGFEDDPAYMLSAGQRRRISLARLLVTAARLWVLDEPLTALDRRGTALVESIIAEHLEGGGLLLFTTHQPLASVPRGTRTLALA